MLTLCELKKFELDLMTLANKCRPEPRQADENNPLKRYSNSFQLYSAKYRFCFWCLLGDEFSRTVNGESRVVFSVSCMPVAGWILATYIGRTTFYAIECRSTSLFTRIWRIELWLMLGNWLPLIMTHKIADKFRKSFVFAIDMHVVMCNSHEI